MMRHNYISDRAIVADRKVRERRERERQKRKRIEAAAPDLYAALKKAVNLIKRFHGMGEGHPDIAEESWKLYYENAPEMEPIKAALAKVGKEK